MMIKGRFTAVLYVISLFLFSGFTLAAGVDIFATPRQPFLPPSDDPQEEIFFNDFNGDGKADIAIRNITNGNVAVHFNNTPAAFSVTADFSSSAVTVPDIINWGCYLADMNGDGKADVINHARNSGDIFVHYNMGTHISSGSNKIYGGLAPVGAEYRIFFADMNSDGFDDLCTLNQQTGLFEVYLNDNEVIATTAFISQQVGHPCYPYNGWESLVADVTGDGKADFLNFDHVNVEFQCFENLGDRLATTAYKFNGLNEKYEHQYFLTDFDGDGICDLAQINLRRGELVVHRLLNGPNINPEVHMQGFIAEHFLPDFLLLSEGRNLISGENHSVDAMMWYENDNLPETGRPAGQPHSGWFYLNPNHPDIVPANQPDAHWRTTTPLLGLYSNKDPLLIKQHGYWLRAMGIQAVCVDWTNISASADFTDGIYYYSQAVRNATLKMLETWDSVQDYNPPKVIPAMRMREEYAPFTISTQIADDVWNMYLQHPDIFYTTHDGTTNREKPLLIVFCNFHINPAWKTTGPPWGDSRFNMRFMNGFYYNQPTMLAAEDANWKYVAHDFPYWAFVENTVRTDKPGYYRNVYRKIANTNIPEHAMTWASVSLGGLEWDGLTELVGGKYCLERYSEPLYTKLPRISMFCRWSYPTGWYNAPYEGVSLNGSTHIEPNVDWGFEVYDVANRINHDLRGLAKHRPGKPILLGIEDRSYMKFSSSNYPLEVKVSSNADGSGGTWNYININSPRFLRPASATYYVRTRNSFGESAVTCSTENSDGIINFLDYAEFAENYGWTGNAGENRYDLVENGTVDIADLYLFTLRWLDTKKGN